MNRIQVFLLTDFGTSDPYVGQMKARFLSLVPEESSVTFVDICHDVARGSIESAAWVLANSLEYIPPGSVLVAVVDPGVGTSRGALACASSSGVLMTGPDNGIFSWLDIASAAAVPDSRDSEGEVSSTFHGRDVFAVVAARLALEGQSYVDALPGLDPAEDLVVLERPVRRAGKDGAECRVAAIDHFGNVVLWLEAPPGGAIPPGGVLALPSGERMPYSSASTYQGGGSGLLLLRGSQGFFELAIDGGDASILTGLRPGDPVILIWAGNGSDQVRQ